MNPEEPRAQTVGVLAQALLVENEPLAVLAAFDHSLYLRDTCGRTLCVLGDGMEPGPLHLLVSHLPASLGHLSAPGEPVRVQGGYLAGPVLRIDLRDVRVWSPPPFEERLPSPRFIEHALIPTLVAAAPGDSLFRAAFATAAKRPDPLWNALVDEVDRGLRELARWLGNSSADAPTSLLGLGPGLTPSGDDILAGVLLALRASGRQDWAAALLAALEPLLNTRTNTISAAHLCAAGLGQGAAVFHDCLNAILSENLPCHELQRVGNVGHSSGWDALLGMVWALRH